MYTVCPNSAFFACFSNTLSVFQGRLNIEGERVWPVATLSVPDPALAAASLDGLLSFDAIQLFVERAREIKPGFGLTEANANAITQICQRLKGLPLAIELAAARINLLTPAEIAARLTQRLNPIITASRTTLPRHQTLRAAIGWSYDLLSAPEQTLLRRLAIFTGGFTLDAAKAVADTPNTLNLLSRLVDKSLLLSQVAAEQTRYRMLEVIREFAQSKLDETAPASDEAHALISRYIAYFLQLAEQTATSIQSDGEAAWLRPDADNFRTAIDKALAQQDWEAGIRLIGALSWYWWMRGYLVSYQEPVKKFLCNPDQATPASGDMPARDWVAAGITLDMWGEPATARPFLERAISRAGIHTNVDSADAADALHEPPYDPATAGIALRILARIAIEQQDFTSANELIERSIAIWRTLGGTWHVGWLLSYQGDLALLRGDVHQAWISYETSSRMPIGPGARAYLLRQMAYLALEQGRFAQAAALCRESLSINLEIGDQQGIAACLACQAAIGIASTQHLPEAARFQTLRRSAQLLGVVTSLLAKLQSQLLQRDQIAFEQNLQILDGQASDITPFKIAISEGRVMVIEQAIALALQDNISSDTLPSIDPHLDLSAEPTDSTRQPLRRDTHRDLRRDLREMPTIPVVHGRSQELQQLGQWLVQGQCQLVAVSGRDLSQAGFEAGGCSMTRATPSTMSSI